MAKTDVNHRIYTLNCNGHLLVLDRPLVMGIINATPDSFYAGSRFQGADRILEQAEKMLEAGAAIIDIGAQSTRPGSEPVGEPEELERLLPAIDSVHRHFPNSIISVDTYYAAVASQAVSAGAGMVNDVSGGNMDPGMLEAVGRLHTPYICMHMKGVPRTMHLDPVYDHIITEITDYFIRKIDLCTKAGIYDVILDPGFGFGKTITHNFQLLRELSLFSILEKPLLAGISRKSTIYRTLGITPEASLNGTTVLNTMCLLNGAHILRVHDVREAVEAVKLITAFQEAG